MSQDSKSLGLAEIAVGKNSCRFENQDSLYNIIDRLNQAIHRMDLGQKSRLRRNNQESPDCSEFFRLLKNIVLEENETISTVQVKKWAWIMSFMATMSIHHNPKVSFGQALAMHVEEMRVARMLNAQGDFAMLDILGHTLRILDHKAQDFDWAEVAHMVLAGPSQHQNIRRKIAKSYYAVLAKKLRHDYTHDFSVHTRTRTHEPVDRHHQQDLRPRALFQGQAKATVHSVSCSCLVPPLSAEPG